MINILFTFGTFGLLIQAIIGFLFFISCIQEKEKRATVFAGIQFIGMLVLLIFFVYLKIIGFYQTPL